MTNKEIKAINDAMNWIAEARIIGKGLQGWH